MKPKLKRGAGVLRIQKKAPKTRRVWLTGVLRFLLLIIWIAWLIVLLLHKLFFKLPNKPSKILGVVRTVLWILFLFNFDFDSLNKSTDNVGLQFIYVTLPFVGIGFLIVSFAIIIGFRYPWDYNGVDRAIPSLENHQNIQSAIDVMDSQLSCYKTRSDFVDSFLKRK